MSDWFEKLNKRTETGGRARATIEQLRKRWGVRIEKPGLIEIRSMNNIEFWKPVDGRKDLWEQV